MLWWGLILMYKLIAVCKNYVFYIPKKMRGVNFRMSKVYWGNVFLSTANSKKLIFNYIPLLNLTRETGQEVHAQKKIHIWFSWNLEAIASRFQENQRWIRLLYKWVSHVIILIKTCSSKNDNKMILNIQIY